MYHPYCYFFFGQNYIIFFQGQRCQFTLSSAGYILYAIANLWPSWYTMVPSAIILGFATGISWAGATLFIPTLATDTGLTAPLLYSIFTGIVQVS